MEKDNLSGKQVVLLMMGTGFLIKEKETVCLNLQKATFMRVNFLIINNMEKVFTHFLMEDNLLALGTMDKKRKIELGSKTEFKNLK